MTTSGSSLLTEFAAILTRRAERLSRDARERMDMAAALRTLVRALPEARGVHAPALVSLVRTDEFHSAITLRVWELAASISAAPISADEAATPETGERAA